MAPHYFLDGVLLSGFAWLLSNAFGGCVEHIKLRGAHRPEKGEPRHQHCQQAK
tara:strand:- start:1491 stop:1649 length:159 start_codon:yes stop_codon:yes gene_type:complete